MAGKSENYLIRQMSKQELELVAVEWAAQEGWNPGLYDVDAFYETDPNGYFVGMLRNIPIACISAVKYNEDFGFVGFYIVKEEYRGKGYGLKIWQEALSRFKTQNVSLDGVLAQQENYKKSGFKFAYSNIRYEGTALKKEKSCAHTVEITELLFKDILAYDSKLFPAPRAKFLKPWLKQPESTALASVKDGLIRGYGMIRKCRKGHKIGPLFADDRKTAEELFISLQNSIPSGSQFYFDTPEVNPDAVSIAEKNEMKKVFETARMYTKREPDINLNQVFGVTTFELG